MKFTSTGIHIGHESWQRAAPYPDEDQNKSAIRVHLKDAPDVVLTEEFLVHAIHLLLHDARRCKIKGVAERIMSCLT